MADCNQILRDYNDAIKLSSTKESQLRTSRSGLRKRIKDKISKRDDEDVKSRGQGSFYAETIIAPSDGDYDVDDGVYFLYKGSAPDLKPASYHNRIVNAVTGYTDDDPIDKNTCVRVLFKGGYHVDLPIYRKVDDEIPELAHKKDGWIESDPKAFADWLTKQVDADGQLRRVIRYLKGWKDHRQGSLPSGLVLTILACDHFASDKRDDIALRDTLTAIRDALKKDYSCLRPTTPVNEDLLANASKSAKKYTLDRLDSFVTSAEEAVEHEIQRRACLKWEKHLGSRISCPTQDSLTKANRYDAPAHIRTDGRSA